MRGLSWAGRASLYRATAPLMAAGYQPDTVPAPWMFNATVVEDEDRIEGVHDADTINVDVDWGFRRHDVPIPVRVLGINARELSMPGGKEARDYVRTLLPAGTPVVLKTAKPDKYAPRWDAVVLFNLNGLVIDLGAHLVVRGWAAPWDGTSKAPAPMWPRLDVPS